MEQIPVSIQITNPTIFPVSNIKLYIEYQNTYSGQRFKKTISASLDYRTKTSVIFHITSQYAGNMKISLRGFRIYDNMKLFSLKRKTNNSIKVAVLPSYYELENYEMVDRNSSLIDSDNYSPHRKGDDPSEVFEIREYREGDCLQRIHWKLSMKQDQLMIKEFSDPVHCSVLLFINLNIPENEKALCYMDAILECALSLSYTFLLKEQLHYISWYDKELGECVRVCVTQEQDLYEAADGLLQAIPYTESMEGLASYQAQYPHDHYSTLFIISPNISDRNMEALASIKADTRRMIYMDNNKKRPVEKELLMKYTATGVNLFTIDIGNIRNEMEQLSWV
jgi:hypothetical protein